jgi:hypothetical protein
MILREERLSIAKNGGTVGHGGRHSCLPSLGRYPADEADKNVCPDLKAASAESNRGSDSGCRRLLVDALVRSAFRLVRSTMLAFIVLAASASAQDCQRERNRADRADQKQSPPDCPALAFWNPVCQQECQSCTKETTCGPYETNLGQSKLCFSHNSPSDNEWTISIKELQCLCRMPGRFACGIGALRRPFLIASLCRSREALLGR